MLTYTQKQKNFQKTIFTFNSYYESDSLTWKEMLVIAH